ncbi:heme oxygenase (biliverdin-producing) [Gordonia phthalatica]|uniref:Heme oxygenase n=1 Tax=Gordonia phthalatica TaxID=1136941 RepID=A0A0N9N947_9ACTN|nr:biliverdin-producing heme oxygenase [Gordonia phthalatica]ALG83884.1 heme oxygenase [Gordonia phthalatica]
MTITSPALVTDARLSVQMKQDSLVEHEQAENSPFIADLLTGRVDAAGYIAYLHRLRIVYVALERASRELADDLQLRHVHDPALERVAAIDADLADWARLFDVALASVSSPAAEAYAQRITDVSTWGGNVVAHHYTRYLGDLSGGQVMGRILDRTFGLDGAGTAMYSFDLATPVKPYKDAYRRSLDVIGESLDASQRAQVVDEVRLAFRLNRALFAELDQLRSV